MSLMSLCLLVQHHMSQNVNNEILAKQGAFVSASAVLNANLQLLAS